MNGAKARKLRLWNKDPHCHWCGVLTVIIDHPKLKNPPDNLATVDHLRSKLNAQRGVDHRVNTVLACLKCNNRRALEEERRVLSLEDKRRRSGRWPVAIRELEAVLDGHEQKQAQTVGRVAQA